MAGFSSSDGVGFCGLVVLTMALNGTTLPPNLNGSILKLIKVRIYACRGYEVGAAMNTKSHGVVGVQIYNMYIIRQKADFNDNSYRGSASILASRLGRDAHLAFAFKNRQGPMWSPLTSRTTMFRGASIEQQVALKASLDPLARQVGTALGVHITEAFSQTHKVKFIESGDADTELEEGERAPKPDLILEPRGTGSTIIVEVKTKWGLSKEPSDSDREYTKNIAAKLNIANSKTYILIAAIPNQPSPSTFTTRFILIDQR